MNIKFKNINDLFLRLYDGDQEDTKYYNNMTITIRYDIISLYSFTVAKCFIQTTFIKAFMCVSIFCNNINFS